MRCHKSQCSRMLWIVVLIAIAGSAFSQSEGVPKNVILFIGDGMGVSHLTAAKITKGKLQMERLGVGGLLMTHSTSSLVTDSAAAGTALATGEKTYNGAISVTKDQRPIATVLEHAEKKGKRTGLVSSCSITHATPASFAAHVKNRSQDAQIAEQIVDSGVDVIFGGGRAYFLPSATEGSKRKDDKDLLAVLGKRMKVIQSAEEFAKLGKNLDAVAGFFADKHPGTARDRNPKLVDLTRKAIEILSRSKTGFFLMVEGSQIDWEAHGNRKDGVVGETVDFDDAVGVGMDFAQKDGQTLVVVTADHETGGFAVHKGSISDKTVSEGKFTSGGHTAAMVPIFAYGPGSTAFGGIDDNTMVGRTLIKYMLTTGTTTKSGTRLPRLSRRR